jgi:vacuolar protein sorting-associated protein 45
MDGISIVRQYVDRMVQGGNSHQHSKSGNGIPASSSRKSEETTNMKILLLDAVTTQVISAVYSQTELLKQHIYLVSTLEKSVKNRSENTSTGRSLSTSAGGNQHLTALCFLRPTLANVDLLCAELQQPQYAAYFIYFTGTLPSSSTTTSNSSNWLRKLAEQDLHQKVQQVQEFYADFLPANADLWTLQCRHTLAMTVSAGTSWAPKHAVQYERHVSGVCHMLLALKRRPYCIRYAAHSPCAEELARDVHDIVTGPDDRYHFRSGSGPASAGGGGGFLLLILDRRDDPVTPLLSQWTYQAMVHELLGLNNHRVVLRGAPGIAKDLEEVVLSSSDDEFYNKHKFSNFGELGEAIQQLLRDYQTQSAQHTTLQNFSTVADMQQFMDKYPELRTKSHVVSKHVAIMGELARLVQICSLMDVSQFEQALACQDDHSAHWRELLDKLTSPTIKVPDKLRLGLLYALRYETSANLHMLQQVMSKGGVPADMMSLIPTMLRYGGYQQRTPHKLYADSHNIMSRMTKNIVGAVAGVDNVYAQHVPILMDTIQQVLRGKLSTKEYPIIASGTSYGAPKGTPSSFNNNVNSLESVVPEEVLIFMVGGITYEEGMKISELNQQNKGRGIRFVLAGSTVHNSTSFLDELRATAM